MYRHRTKYIHFYEHSTRWEERYGDKFLLASPKIVIVARNGLLSLNYVTNTIKVVPDMAVLRNFCIPSHNIYIYSNGIYFHAAIVHCHLFLVSNGR